MPRANPDVNYEISIHALLAESDVVPRANPDVNYEISIHALLAESDGRGQGYGKRHLEFLSTLSLRRATTQIAPRSVSAAYFYPRSPCGERLWPR